MSDLSPEVRSWIELMQLEEDLLPELEAYYEEGGNFPMVRHPLVFSVPHSPQQNAMVNEQYRHKLAGIHKALTDNNIGSYIALHERPYRIDAFIEFDSDESTVVSSGDYWTTLSDIYTDSENIYQNFDRWIELLNDTSMPARCMLMSKSERKHLIDFLPQQIVIYRGYKYSNTSKWLSWTTSFETAKFFADRFVADGHVASAVVDKSDVIAFFNSRQENEILVRFYDVSEVIMQVGE